MLAGFTITCLIEFQPPPEINRIVSFCYYTSVMASLTANIFCVAGTTGLSVLGTSLSLRGPDGSMFRAVEGMYVERRRIFTLFAFGLIMMLISAFWAAWIILPLEGAAACSVIVVYGTFSVMSYYKRVERLFSFDESDAPDFNDIVDVVVPLLSQTSSRFQRRLGGAGSPRHDEDVEADDAEQGRHDVPVR